MTPRRITLVTACRNAARWLPETIESVLNQTVIRSGELELEYRIVDGASTDETARVMVPYLDDPRIHFTSEPDGGFYEALARGLKQASGDIVAYLNAGDVYFPHAFEILREVFSNEEVDWATGYSCLINESSQPTAAWKPPRFRREFVRNGTYLRGFPIPNIQQESTFWSGRANQAIDFERLAQFKLAGDYFIWTELAKNYELHSIMTLLGAFRQHAGQLSEQREAYHSEIQSALRPATRREDFTAWWEFRADSWIRKYLWKWTLPPSRARLFEYSAATGGWKSR